MKPTEHDDLVSGELDRVNTPEQSEALRAYLEQNAEAKQNFEEIQRIVSAMESEGHVDVPEGLENRVLSSIPFHLHPAERATRYDERTGWLGWLGNVFARPTFRFAGAFGVGLVAGALVWSAVSNRGAGTPFDYTLDISKISGTIKTINHAEGYTRVGELELSLDGVQGEFQLHRHDSDKTLLAEVTLRSEVPIEWVLEYDADEVALDGFRRFSGPEGSSSATVSQTPSQMRASHTGDGRYILFFTTHDRLEAPMTVRIFSSDQLLFEDTITEKHDD